MAAHKQCGGEAAAAELAVEKAASRGAAMAAHGQCGGGAAAAEPAVDEAASERRSDGRAQAGRRRSGSGAGG